jgi:phosphohistidine swiveling domain-containing protein
MLLKLNTNNKDVSPEKVGGKGFNLIKLSNNGFNVPPGFVISTDEFIEETKSIKVKISKLLTNLDESNIQQVSQQIKSLITGLKLSDAFKNGVNESFKNLGAPSVAVRSSAASEDGSGASWAGQLSTKLNVKQGKLEAAIKRCWASSYSERALTYAITNKFSLKQISVAVVVQKMVASDVSGVAFSVNPVNNNSDEIIIEAVYGLGEAIVSGAVTPDEYIVDVSSFTLSDFNLAKQEKMLVQDKNSITWVQVLATKREEQKLSLGEVKNLARTIKEIELKMGYPADVEWAIEANQLFITQSRPITTLNKDVSAPASIFPSGVELFRWGPTKARYFYIGDFIEKAFTSLKSLNLTYTVFNGDEMVWVGENDKFRDFCKKEFKKLLANPAIVENNSDAFDLACERIDNLYNNFNANAIKQNVLAELLVLNNAISKFWEPTLAGEMANYGSEEYIESMLKASGNYSDKQVIRIMETMCSPEEKSFLQIIDEDIKLSEDTELLAKKYSWIENGYGGVKILDQDYFKKIKESISGGINDDGGDSLISSIKNKKLGIIKEFKLNDELVEAFNLLVKLTVEQDRRKMYMMKIQELKFRYLEILLGAYDIAQQMETVLDYSMQEIISILGLGDKGIIIKPKQSEFGYKNGDGRILQVESSEAKSVWYHYGSEKTMTYGKILKGSTASYGVNSKVRAVARVVESYSSESAADFIDGEILVVAMTTPEYLSLIKKSSAIVTNVGGLTSHAAIIARELGKPCVVGTKAGTKVIKTGDLLYVNTHTGTVEILKSESNKN